MLPRMTKSEISDARQQVQTVGWLAATPADFRTALLDHCLWQRIPPQVVLTHGGDIAGGLVGVITGAVDIVSAIGPSDSPIAHIAPAPFWFGELPTVGHRSRTITVSTRTACDIVLIPQTAIEIVMATRPEWWRLLGILSLEGITLVTQIATDLLIADTRRRCVAVLLRLAGCRKVGDGPIVVGVGQDELAAMANLSRQTCGVVLRALEVGGAVKLGYRNITVVAPAALREIVDV